MFQRRCFFSNKTVMTTVNRYRIFCNTENAYVYTWDTSPPTTCPNNNTHTVDISSVTLIDSVSEDTISLVSGLNSSSLSLASSGTFEGDYEEVGKYTQMTVFIVSDTAKYATLEVYFATSSGGTYTSKRTVLIGDNKASQHVFPVVANYAKIKVIANQGTTFSGYVQVIYHKNKNVNNTVSLAETIYDTSDAQLSRSVIAGEYYDTYTNVNVSQVHANNFALNTAVTKPLSSFGEIMTSKITHVLQLDNVFNDFNNQMFEQYTYDSSGANSSNSLVYSSNAMVVVESSTSSGSYCISQSKRDIIARPGQGMNIRFAGMFPSGGIQNTYQLMGFGNNTDGTYIGYSGSNFGIIQRNWGEVAIYKLSVTQAATSNTNCTVTLNSVNYTIPLTAAGVGSSNFTAFEIAKQGTLTNSSNELRWIIQNIQNDVYFAAFTHGPRIGTYSFDAGASGTLATGTLISSGSNYVESFTPQSSFNIDKLDGTGKSTFTINPSTGNIYDIMYEWFGFGAYIFSVQDSYGNIIPFHKISNENALTRPQVSNPHGKLIFTTEVNQGANANKKPQVSYVCANIGIEGDVIRLSPKYSIANKLFLIGTNESLVLALRGRVEYNKKFNVSEAYISNISLAVTTGQSAVRFRLYLNPTLSPTASASDFPSYKYIDANNSSMLYTTSSSTITGGTIITQYVVTSNFGLNLSSKDFNDIIITENDTLVITAEGENNTVDVTISWIEDH